MNSNQTWKKKLKEENKTACKLNLLNNINIIFSLNTKNEKLFDRIYTLQYLSILYSVHVLAGKYNKENPPSEYSCGTVSVHLWPSQTTNDPLPQQSESETRCI